MLFSPEFLSEASIAESGLPGKSTALLVETDGKRPADARGVSPTSGPFFPKFRQNICDFGVAALQSPVPGLLVSMEGNRMNGALLRSAVCGSIFFLPLVSPADLISIFPEDSFTEIAPPPSVQEEALVTGNGVNMYVFAERMNYVLPSAVNVDILGVGRGDNDPITPAPMAGTIPAGTRVDIYFVHHDTPGNSLLFRFGSLGFDTEVLGVIHTDELLDDSDFLGAPGTSYPTDLSERGMAQTIEQFDWVEVPSGPMPPPVSVRVNSAVDVVLDQVRIITVASVIPEPTTFCFVVGGLLGGMLIRRRA
jgi:hypothetical protein